MNARRPLWISSCWLALVLSFVLSCTPETAEAPPPPPPPVHAETVALERMTPTSTSTAEILAVRVADLRAETTGRVVSVEVDAGDRVDAGAVLLRLDVGRTTSAVQAAQAGVSESQARLQQAERELARTKKLVATGGLPEQRLDDASDMVRMARAAQEASRAEANLARRGLTEAVVRAPFGGTVVERGIEVGEWVSPGSPLLTVADTSRLKARVLLDPREALDVEIGSAVSVSVFARPEETFVGRVVRVGEVVDPATRRLPVEIEVDDPEHRIRPGLVGRFIVDSGAPREALRIPIEAVFQRFGSDHAYVIEDGIANRRIVTVGGVRDGLAEVRSGLAPGDLVVTRGVERVVDGSLVRVVPADSRNVVAAEQSETP